MTHLTWAAQMLVAILATGIGALTGVAAARSPQGYEWLTSKAGRVVAPLMLLACFFVGWEASTVFWKTFGLVGVCFTVTASLLSSVCPRSKGG